LKEFPGLSSDIEESGGEFSLSENLMQCANGQPAMENPRLRLGRVVAKAKTGRDEQA